MGSIVDAAGAAFNLLLVFIIGWFVVVFASRYTEQRLRRGKSARRGPGIGDSATWLWDNSNIIGIPTLVLGTAYLIWSMYFGPGLSAGPTMLVIVLMTAAGLLIGFAPGLRR